MNLRSIFKWKGMLIVLMCVSFPWAGNAANVIPYLNALQNFGGSAVDLATFLPKECDYTLEVNGTIGVEISIAGGFLSYTPTTSGVVRFAQRNRKVYVYEGNVYKTTITPTFTIYYPTIADADAASNTSNLLQNPSFETYGALLSGGTGRYKFGGAWTTNVTEAYSGIRCGTSASAVNGSYVCVWRGSGNGNYIAQPLTSIKANTSYKVIIRQIAGGNAYANFNIGLGSTVNGLEYDYNAVSLGNGKDGTWSTILRTPSVVNDNSFFTFRNTPTNTASSGSDPVTQIDYFVLQEGLVTVSSPGIVGASSASIQLGNAYAPEGVAVNYINGDCYDVTPKVMNPSFEFPSTSYPFQGWTNTGMARQNNTSPTWAKDGTYYIEKWIAAGSNLPAASVVQTISNLPNGKYKLTVSGHATQGASSSTTGASVFAGSASTAVNAPGDYVVDNATVATGTLQIGFKLEGTITANWAAFDNFKLYYYGPIPLLSAPQSSLSLTTSSNSSNVVLTGENITEDITFSVPAHVSASGTNVVDNLDGTYKILAANSNAGNTIVFSWDKAATVSATINFVSGTASKSVSLTTSDISNATLSNITLSAGSLSPAFSSSTYAYVAKVPANTSSITITGVQTDASSVVTNNGTVLTRSASSVTMGLTSYDGLNTKDYSVSLSPYVMDDWDANGSKDATFSIPTVYGWNATPSLTWVVANSTASGTVRYMDISNGANAGLVGITYTYAGSNYDGRILFQRWDGSASRVYSYPVYLEGCKSYDFTGKAAWNSVATAPTLTFRVNSAADNTGTTYGSGAVVTSTAGALSNFSISNFRVPTTGVYYITTTSSTASLCAVADLVISDNTTESFQISTQNLYFDANNLTRTFTVTGNLLTNDISLSAPEGITLSASGVTSGKDITISKTEAQCGIVVTATWNNASSIINLPIHLTSGASLSQDANLLADKNECSSLYYNDRSNLIAEPFMNYLTPYSTNSWGALSVATGSEAYCGYGSAKLVGVNGASITTNNISWLPNTKYRVRAMVKTMGDFQFGFQNTYAGTGATYEIVIPSTNGEWKQVDYIFTTGGSASTGYAYFNMQNRGGTLGYIDNWELYNISDLTSEPNFAVKSWEQKVDQSIPTASFEVAPTGKLTINASNTLNATSLVLLSDATGTATLVDNGTFTGTVTIKQYLTGSTNSETGAPNGRFWYVTSPIVGANSSVFAPSAGNKLWSHSEATNAYTQIVDDATSLTPGLGYVARMKANTTVSFTGTPNSGDKTIQVTRTGSTNAYRGFNLVGNPYPSFARIKYEDNTDLESSLWFRTKTGGSNAMVFDSYNILTGDSVSGSGNPISGYIPPMQAFWVKKTTEGNANLTFKQIYRFHKDPITTGIKLRSAEASVQPYLRLRLTNGSTKDETLIKFYPNATDGFDAFDTRKMTNSIDSFPEIYTVCGKDELAINGMRHDGRGRAIALGFRSGKAGKFAIRVIEKRHLGDTVQVILKDKLKGTDVVLEDSTTYEFTTDAALTTTDRFSVVIGKASTALIENALANADVYTDSEQRINVRLIGATSSNVVVTVYNTVGKEVGRLVSSSTNTVLAKKFAPGLYVVKIEAGNLNLNKKVVINQ